MSRLANHQVYALALAHRSNMDRRQRLLGFPPLAEDPTLSMAARAYEALVRVIDIEHTCARGGRPSTADCFAAMAHLSGLAQAIHEAETVDLSTGEDVAA